MNTTNNHPDDIDEVPAKTAEATTSTEEVTADADDSLEEENAEPDEDDETDEG